VAAARVGSARQPGAGTGEVGREGAGPYRPQQLDSLRYSSPELDLGRLVLLIFDGGKVERRLVREDEPPRPQELVPREEDRVEHALVEEEVPAAGGVGCVCAGQPSQTPPLARTPSTRR
jgi:hypothetical protein